MTFDDFEEEVCNFEDGCSGWERFLPICKDYAYQLYDENQALQQRIHSLESQLSSNPLQLTKLTNEELMIELSSRGLNGDDFDKFSDDYNRTWGD